MVPFAILSATAGSALQGYANGTADSWWFGVLLMLSGIGAVRLVFPQGAYEARAFLLTFGVCVFTGGLAQCYSLARTGEPQSFVDAIGFFDAIFDAPPYYTWEELNTLWIDGGHVSRGAPLSVAIWQWVYHVRYLLGLDYGIYVGVMFNALCIGLTAAITVRTARELFGDDPWRLRRVGILFAFCGLFALFGAIFIRDCFTTFFNALVLWGIVRWMCLPNARNLGFAGMLTAISVLAMAYLRSRSIVLFGLFWLLAVTCWYVSHRLDMKRALVAILAIPVVLAGSVYVVNYVLVSRNLQARHMEQYEEILAEGASENSIAMQLVVNQPLPVRLVLGTGSLMVFPIPLWAYFEAGRDEYHLLKGYNGVYQVMVMPLVIIGFLTVLQRIRGNRKSTIPLLFLGAYLVMNVLAVVATSLEQRHIAQFMPAFMILAAVADTRTKTGRKRLRDAVLAWSFLVVFVHVAWAAVAFGR